MAVSESAHAAWTEHISRNRTDATDHSLTAMSSDEPLDFSLKKRVRRNAPEMDWSPPASSNPLLKSYLDGSRSAFEPVGNNRGLMPISPFLVNLLRSTPVATPTTTSNRTVRLFKAYNPTDPASALSVGYGLGDISPMYQGAPDIMSEIHKHRKTIGGPKPLSQQPRSHSVPSQANNKNQSQQEVTSSTATPPGSGVAMDLSPTASTRENSNSPTSTSDLTRTQAVKREHSPPIDVLRYSPDPKSDSGSSSDSRCPASVPTTSNAAALAAGPLMARSRRRGQSMPDELKDNSYWERRRKNNEAAKRSRDSRRAKEDEIAMRAAFLEQENIKLRIEVAALRSETDKLRHLLLNS